MRSGGPNGAPISGLVSMACAECRCMIAPSVAAHGSVSSRMFQTSDRVPPGTRTRAISGTVIIDDQGSSACPRSSTPTIT
jgi:hypothetical protein